MSSRCDECGRFAAVTIPVWYWPDVGPDHEACLRCRPQETEEIAATTTSGLHRCGGCGGTNTTYALFSGGREYYCEDCDDNFPYEEGQAPRRVQMIADGKFDELREEMKTCTCVPGYVVCDACRERYYQPQPRERS